MSVVRWSDRSDVYVFASMEHDCALVCFGCGLGGGVDVVANPVGMIRHLEEHKQAGDKVPDYAFTNIEERANEFERWHREALEARMNKEVDRGGKDQRVRAG